MPKIRIECQSLKDAIGKLQEYADYEWCLAADKSRRWQKAIPQDSYGDKEYKIELWTLEGSPAKLVVIINHFRQIINCYSDRMKLEKIFYWGRGKYCIHG